LNSVYFPDASTGYAAGYAPVNGKGAILKTSDAGVSWNVSLSEANNAFYSIFFVNDSIGYAAGWNGTIVKTTDGGSIWTNLSSGTMATINSVFFLDADKGYVVDDRGEI